MDVKTTPKTIAVEHARGVTARWDDASSGLMLVVTNHEGRGTWTIYRANGAPLAGGLLSHGDADNYISNADSRETREWVAQRIFTADYRPGGRR